MSEKICVIASHDRRRAGLRFKKGQRTIVDRPEDDDAAERLLDALVADPVLTIVPLDEDDEAEDPQDEVTKPKSRGRSRAKRASAPKGDKAGTQGKPAE